MSVREQVLALVRASFGAQEARVATTTGDAALEAFLHEPAQLALTAVHDAAAGTLTFSSGGGGGASASASGSVSGSAGGGAGASGSAELRVLHFVKLRPQALTDASSLASTVLISSTLRSPLASLYAALHHVHGPSLLQDAHWAALLDEGTRKLLVELDGRLATCLQRDGGGGGGGNSTSASAASTANIFSLSDEARFWEDAAAVASQSSGRGGGDSSAAARTAEAFARALQPLAPRFDSLAQSGDAQALPLALELVVDAESALDELWRLPLPAASAYPQHRMRHLLACCGAQLAAFLQRAGARLDLWDGAAFNDCRGWLQDAARLCDAWASLLTRLTRDMWPAGGGGGGARAAWSGEPARDALLEQLGARLVQLLELRTTQEELSALLPVGVQRQCGLADAAAPLRRLHPLHVGEAARGAWDGAVAAYERALAPADVHAAAELGRELRLAKGQAHQLLRVLQLYRHTLRARRGVAALLIKERDEVVAQLSAQLAALATELRRRTASALEAGAAGLSANAGVGAIAEAGALAEAPSCVGTIAWVQVVRSRAALVRAIASDLLGEAEAARSDLAEASDALRDDCELAVQRLHGAWRAACESALRRGELSLESTGRIMEFDADGNMRVRYSEQLVALLRDARALAEQGLAVPKEVRAAAADAEKYYRYAVQLQKVASFYNTLGAEIVPSQKPLLLAPLAAFENAVQDGARGSSSAAAPLGGGGPRGASVVVTWSEPRQVAAFLEDLQRKADELGAANRRLRALHGAMCDAVAALMEVDMLRQRDSLWRERWAQLRELFARFCAPFVAQLGAASVKGWARHWDMQLYKAVEADYRTGLERLAESIPEMRADVVFSAQARGPAFRPPLEELRAAYYREMRRHVAVPATFGGLTGVNAHDFEAMARRNAAGLHRVYDNAERLFARVAKHRDSLRKWCTLGAHVPDPDAFVEQHVRSIEDFEAALKGLRERREALQGARLEQLVTFDCITLNAAPLRHAAEMQLSALGEALLVALHASLAKDLGAVQAFLASASETLSARPNSMAEIARAKREWTALSQQRGGMEQLGEACEHRRRLLAANAGGLFDLADVTQRLGGLAGEWDNFALKMEAFDGIVEEQRAALKGSVALEISSVGAELDKFAARWAALKPSEAKGWTAPEVAAVFSALEDWGAQLEALRAKAAALRESCESFGLAPPAFKGLEDVAADVTETRATWELFRGYDGERQALAGQDWVSFRARLFDLQDFAAKWADAVRGKTKGDAVRTRIFDEADGVKRAFGALKYARGEPFKEEHWSALFKKLGMPRGVRLETLLVGHFIDAHEACAANLQWLKDLTSRAQGEVTIRDALQELRAWGETADFHLLEHVSNVNGRKTALIKDWKELFTEIGDNQSLLQSLKESAYFKPFADTAAALEQSLATVDECAQALNAIQRRWVYLEPVFGRGALPSEGPRFKRVDEQFRDIMGKVAQDPKVLSLADAALHPGLRDALQAMVDQLERCQKALADFLEEKRAKMSRFYFIGDDDLLEILGQAQNPAVIQSHLKKLYQGVYRVEFSDSPRREPAAARAGAGAGAGTGAPAPSKFIVAMCSVAGEVVPLDNAVAVTDDVTQWLTAFTREMSASLASLLVACVRAAHGGEAWEARLPRFPSQVLCLCEQVLFTEAVERILAAPGGAGAGAARGSAEAKASPQAEGLTNLRARLTDQLAAYTARKGAAGDSLGSLKVKALVLDVIHMLDVVDALASRDVRDAGSWHWQKQLRFYLSENGRCTARMVDASLDYTFEYQGNAPKLVHTPLTDKCFLTITQGLAMGYGGNPYGPAGTGKTESVKALGAAVGRQVLVFNCDEGIDFLSMGRIFTGLVKCGAWG
jgi:dynein heavy chain 2